MSKYYIIVCILLISSSIQSQSVKKQLEEYMDAEVAINNFSGTVLITMHDSILLKKAYGLADYELEVKNTIDTKFSLASVSKQFTALAILQLAQRKQLSLADPITKFYPSFPRGDSITIKMLLNHSSGIGDGLSVYESNTFISSDSLVKLIGFEPLLFPPGSQSRYSNTAYNMLTYIIEKVSGMSFKNYMIENLFKRAGMHNSGISSNDSIVHNMSKTYYSPNGQLIKSPLINWYYNSGHDGVYSTVEDLYKWNKSLFDDTLLLSENFKEQMFTPYNDTDFGYGLMINPFYNLNHYLITHTGGYYGTMTSFNKFPDDDVFIAVLSNNASPSHIIAYGLSAVVFGLPVELPYAHIEAQIDRKIFSEYVGQYENIRIHQIADKLYYSDHNIELIPESESKFFRANDHNRTIEFIRNKEGKVSEIITTMGGVQDISSRN